MRDLHVPNQLLLAVKIGACHGQSGHLWKAALLISKLTPAWHGKTLSLKYVRVVVVLMRLTILLLGMTPTVKCYLDLSGQIWMVFYCYYHHYLLLLLLLLLWSSASLLSLSSSSSPSPSPWTCRLRQAVLSLQTHRRKASARQWQLFWDQIFFPLPCGCPKRAMVIKTDLCSYTE